MRACQGAPVGTRCWPGLAYGLAVLFSADILVLGCSGSASRPAPERASQTPAPPKFSSSFTLQIPTSALSETQQILHVLNRLSYGPRPGDLQRVREMGLAAWMDQQLHPGRIPDEKVASLLQGYPALDKPTSELLEKFPTPPPPKAAEVRPGQMPGPVPPEPPPERRPYRIIQELQAARLVRAVMSERQLQEVMVDFWLNHFNVFAHKDLVKWMLPAYEREVIRPHALGRFRDLLLNSARHPAMLFYLDNWLSVGPGTGRAKQSAGLNENYARELMELHTLGVDGGYTEYDVREVARCFTGWTIDKPRVAGQYIFRPAQHDLGEKRVLGEVLPPGGGERDGLLVIDLLARHPSTARFIATKLARRFIRDDPPPALVDRAARTFTETDGDIRATLGTILTSPEFFATETYRAKIKRPLEYVVSTVRVLGGDLSVTGTNTDGAFQLARMVAGLGEPLYEAEPPTGYPDVARAWVNPGALLRRMNFTLTVTTNRLPGVWVNLPQLLGGIDRRQPDLVLQRLVRTIIQDDVTAASETILTKLLGDPRINHGAEQDHSVVNTDAETLAALVLGSPDFQRR